MEELVGSPLLLCYDRMKEKLYYIPKNTKLKRGYYEIYRDIARSDNG
jgi:hypothetical protein